jgi:2',3'-cyclic-nucleotide 2'-phosphodiesterase (5'-nucleotidase family)
MVMIRSIFILMLPFLLTNVYSNDKTSFDVVLITMADLHGQVEPAFELKQDNVCKVGGFSCLSSAIKKTKEKYPDAIVVATGDYLFEDFRNGKFFQKFQGKAIFSLMNDLNIDVATLGNHDFDFGSESTLKALQYRTFPIVMSNMTFKTPILDCYSDYVVEKKGCKIGFIGLMTDALSYYPSIGSELSQLDLNIDILEVTKEKVKKLKEIDKVDFIVVLSHMGLATDKKLASSVCGIDVICGGHSHDKFEKGQEVVVIGPNKEKTVIVYPDAYTKHIGVLKLSKEDNSHDWDLVKVDDKFISDKEIESKINSYLSLLNKSEIKIAESLSVLDTTKSSLRTKESAIGNLIADILKKKFSADIAMITGSSIRGGKIIPPKDLFLSDIEAMLPFDIYPSLLKIKGKYILQALEDGIVNWPNLGHNFFQVSGIRYSFVNENKNRIVKAEIQKKDGSYLLIEEEKEYLVVTTSFKLLTKPSSVLFDFASEKEDIDVFIKNLVIEYLKENNIISPVVEGRILHNASLN